MGPLYSELGLTGVIIYNKEDIMQVDKIKEAVLKTNRIGWM